MKDVFYDATFYFYVLMSQTVFLLPVINFWKISQLPLNNEFQKIFLTLLLLAKCGPPPPNRPTPSWEELNFQRGVAEKEGVTFFKGGGLKFLQKH